MQFITNKDHFQQKEHVEHFIRKIDNVDELGMYTDVLSLHLPACRRAGVLGR